MLIQKLQGDYERSRGIYYEFDIHTKPIGIGGMGKVYLGSIIIIETGARIPVAIKALYEDVSESVIERARRESSIQLKHENLVEMMGFVETNDLNSFGGNVKHYHVVSEFVNGVMLSDLLCGMTKNQFGEDLEAAQKLYADYVNDRMAVSIRIIKQVLSGVMALHDNGYIHRDIDPSNIMITDKGTVKLIDFGIAKMLQSLGTQDKNLTSNGAFVGKAQYASPELVTGDIAHQNVTTDIYSVGIMLFQLLTGKLPFSGPTHTVLDAQLHKKLPLKEVKNSDLKKIIAKATEKSQKNRYQSAAEFRVAVDSVVPTSKTTSKSLKYVVYTVASVVILAVAYFIVTNINYDFNFKTDNESEITVNIDTVQEKQDFTISVTKTAINNYIVRVFELDRMDYSGLTKLAKAFYNNKISQQNEEKGHELLKTTFAKDLLTGCRSNTDYSNVKVSFVMFAELDRIGRNNNDQELINLCDKYLSTIKRFNKLYIE
ncbi:MAG: serine/threonine protein kinase [Bacteroidales bacterium]|nr:serine/threonine protein kinase [Bacteroidales bacterium]